MRPMSNIGSIVWINFIFFPGFDNKKPIFTVCVLFLIPLSFLITLKTFFKVPVFGIYRPFCIKFIRPNQIVSRRNLGLTLTIIKICEKGKAGKKDFFHY